MIYYIRKISRHKWQEEPLSDIPEVAQNQINNVSADAITNCLKTTSNKLSLWRVDIDQNNFTINDVIPLIMNFERPNNCDVVYIPESLLLNTNLILQQSENDANTPIEQYKKTHYNIIVNNYAGLGKFSKVVLQSLCNHKRYKVREVETKLKEMLENHVIEQQMISSKLFEKIKT